MRLILTLTLALSTTLTAGERHCTKEEMEKCRRAPATSVKPAEIAASQVSFYTVGLVCAAAPKIGCGSKAKPVLHALSAHSRVAGAWLNEAGTRLAIAWTPGARPLSVDQLDAVLDPHGIAVHPVSAERNELLATFATNTGWYDAGSVDRLSEEEAGIIAARLVKRLGQRATLTAEQRTALLAAIEESCRERFINGDNRDIAATLLDVAHRAGLDATGITALKDVIALGYRPLPTED